MKARHRYAVRFVPPQNAHRVPLDVYAESMRHVQAALIPLVQSAANDYAEGKGWPRFVARVFVEACETGSLAAPIAIECTGEPSLVAPGHLERELLLRVAKRVRAASRGVATDLPSSTAESLVLAARRTADARTMLQIAENSMNRWRPILSLTRIADRLEEYVSKRRLVRTASVQMVGRIEIVRFDGPSFDLTVANASGGVRLRARAEDRERLRSLWGAEVVVTAEVRLTAEGEVKSGGLATSVEPVKTMKNPLADYLASRGAGNGAWDSDEGREYLTNLRS